MATVTAIGTAFGDILFPAEAETAIAPAPAGHLDRHGINEFSNFHK
jgi:hypothetical protein